MGNKRVSIALGKPGTLDEIQGVVANTLNLFRGGAVGFIDWLDLLSVQLVNDGVGATHQMSALVMHW